MDDFFSSKADGRWSCAPSEEGARVGAALGGEDEPCWWWADMGDVCDLKAEGSREKCDLKGCTEGNPRLQEDGGGS